MDIKTVAASLNGSKPIDTRSQERTLAEQNSKPSPASQQTDQVTLTNVSQKLAQVSVASETPDDRQAKIDQIKAAIAAGEYPINPDKIASKLIETERMFAGLN
ncbi:flagellar biosynthesis anti-sigma factor FlgM [Thiomicrospira sp. ALE5]|uniref:flagellar biosynthesis anti-sigma factor FlgM n=1 Tax=Thiomicrospira sp. ALE5 TaxID=748650 RepID=UPI0008E3953D|nr:flagellar biosynthesis anti-sigma factor FlgM [Thiomicrospira sp. ALE5]SFR60152.1 anti-sigma-28 factor, FlgM family [Thiomicrospira sp. ALE5]